MKTDAEMKEALKQAEALTDGVSEGLRSTAFQVILTALLAEPTRVTGERLQTPRAVPATNADGLGINELLVAAGAATHPERVTVIAFHKLHNGGGGVTAKDISEAYAKARTKKPQNIPDVVGQCVQRGYLIDAGQKYGAKSWVITPTGEQFVNKLLSTRKRNV